MYEPAPTRVIPHRRDREKYPSRPRGRAAAAARSSVRPGFSLLELVVVLAVTVVVTSLILPALSQVRENLHRIICSSNLRQLGLGTAMYARDNNDRLPHSVLLALDMPEELIVAHLDAPAQWDGLGRLFEHGYCSAIECYYCPSHHGENDQTQFDWLRPEEQRIYTNYHYGGDTEWVDSHRVRRLESGERLVLATDGLRALDDINHETGLNMLRGDISVRWFEDSEIDSIAAQLPASAGGGTAPGYGELWKKLEQLRP